MNVVTPDQLSEHVILSDPINVVMSVVRSRFIIAPGTGHHLFRRPPRPSAGTTDCDCGLEKPQKKRADG